MYRKLSRVSGLRAKPHTNQHHSGPSGTVRRALQNLHIRYQFDGSQTPAVLERIMFWRDTGEYVGVYVNVVFNRYNPSERWTEHYYWAFRHGEYVEVHQSGVRYVGRRRLINA